MLPYFVCGGDVIYFGICSLITMIAEKERCRVEKNYPIN